MHKKCTDCNHSTIVQVLLISFFPTYTKMDTGVLRKHILEADIYKNQLYSDVLLLHKVL